MDLEEFAAARGARLERSDAELRPLVVEALSSPSEAAWAELADAAAVLWLEMFEDAAPRAYQESALDRFRTQLRESLEKTSVPDGPPADAQIDRVTHWVSTFTTNNATYQGAFASGQRQKQWVARQDDKVRDSHRRAHGQRAAVGGTFDIDGTKLHYPGEPVGPPEVWINCRCLVRGVGRKVGDMVAPDAIRAAAEPFGERSLAVVVALPAENDPISAASSEDMAHMTLVFLGESSELEAKGITVEALREDVAGWAARIDGPLTEGVSGSATLGSDSAEVALVDARSFSEIRTGMVSAEDSPIALGYSSVEQYPNWIPHVTLGYPETPAAGEYSGTEITFDRLALWVGDDRTEFPLGGSMTAAADADLLDDEEAELDEATFEGEDLVDDFVEIPFHGVLAPIGRPSSEVEKRQLGAGPDAADGVTWRPLPLPMLYQPVTGNAGHVGSVVIGSIRDIWVEDDMVRYSGVFNSSPYVSEVISGLADGSIRGVSIDVDIAVIDQENSTAPDDFEAMENGAMLTVFKTSQIAGATVVAIPAFVEAYIALGECDCEDEILVAELVEDGGETVAELREVSGEERKRLADEDKALPDGSFPIANEEDLRNAIQSIGRAKDPAAAKAHIKRRAKALGKEDLIPEEWSAVVLASAEFAPGTKDGPGWITHPRATARIRRYWVRGKGALKIKWGAPGDFNRCRRQLVKYVQNPEWLAGLCANMHKEALGFWPGEHHAAKAEELAALVAAGGVMAPSINLVASADSNPLPAEWFQDPQLTEPTQLTITPEGRVYGHLATWGTCHIGIQGVCTTPPYSSTNYAYFHTGYVETDQGDISVGHFTHGIGHAGDRASLAAATAHYDRDDSAWCDVVVGEDSIGIWYSGALRPGLSDEKRRGIKANGAISGDWRRAGSSGLELVGAVAVGTPGFPIPRTSMAASGTVQLSLVAAGIVQREAAAPTPLDLETQLGIVRAAADEVEHRQARRERLAAVRQLEATILRPARIQRARERI